MTQYHVAQVNIARMLAPIDSETMSGFVARLDEMNAIAEASEGFVWRLKGDENNATALRVFDDNMLIINMSVWESIDALYNYTYKSDHVEVFRQRKDWFSNLERPHMVLWYAPVGEYPSPQDAKQKLADLQQYGATPNAFTFKKRFTVDEWQTLTS